MNTDTSRLLSRICMTLTLIVFLLIYGCSGSDPRAVSGPQPAGVVVEPDQKLSTAPHAFDVYRATNANKAVIFLHGSGGNKLHAAYQFGITLSDMDSNHVSVNEDMLLANRALAVFPQGQAVTDQPIDNQFKDATWSNHVTDSGYNDKKFISDLVGHISAQYHINRFYIVGHSTGGMLANQIWCEGLDLVEGYVAIAGPPSEYFLASETTCSPTVVKPYLGIVRADDSVLGVSGNWDAQTWAINKTAMGLSDVAWVDPVVAGERSFLKTRVMMRCPDGEQVQDSDAGVSDGQYITKWSFCEDSIRLLKVEVDPGEGLGMLQNEVWGFLSSQ